MRTAQEWHDLWAHDTGPCPAVDQIQAIQADAYRAGLLRAAKVCREHEKDLPVLLAGHCCADHIESEAKKGLP